MRLPALVIVTSTNEQYDVLSDSVKERFDHIESLEPFNQEMLSELVTKRIEPLINFAWNPPSEFTTRMISETSGNVGKCIRLLREIFDKQDFSCNTFDYYLLDWTNWYFNILANKSFLRKKNKLI